MTRFNLLDESWIPCVMLDGGRRVELSLRSVVAQGSLIREVADPSPLVTIALHRLVLAILHRVLGPAGPGEWKVTWDRRSWDLGPLGEYLDRWRGRFDLFDESHPFYQTAQLPADRAVSVSKLRLELASGNNRTLFDHSLDAAPAALQPAEAARALVAFQAFALGGTVTAEKGQDYADGAPLIKAALGLVTGRNLFETLMLNLHRYGREDPFPSTLDKPAWERDEPTRPEERTLLGYLDLLTWQSRRIRLIPTVAPSGHGVVVRRAVVMKGYQLPEGFQLRGKETMVAFRRILKPPAGGVPWAPVGFSEERALWRDSLALLQSLAEERTRPTILDWLYELVQQEYLARSATLPLDLFGLTSNRAAVLLWRRERLPLPLAYLDRVLETDLLDSLRRALELSDEVDRVLWTAVTRLGQALLSPGSGRADPERLKALRKSLAPARGYWARLDSPFRRLLVELPDEPGTADTPAWQRPAFRRWVQAVRDAAREAFAEATAGLDGTARTLRAVTEGERAFSAGLYRVMAPYLEEVAHVESR